MDIAPDQLLPAKTMAV
jgi:hypothetical protein